MSKTCNACHHSFEITEQDLIGPKRWDAPPPSLCPDCRHQRRVAFRNERSLYERTCDLCKQKIISVYSPDKTFTVYCNSCFYSDQWSPLQYGRSFDFKRPFFEQFADLQKEVPLLANMVFNSTNSEYNSFLINSKDCYLSTRIGDSENILYSYLSINSLGCIDGFNIYNCQYSYECVDCWNCYNSFFCQNCRDLSDCLFCYDCIGCRDCFGSASLRNVQYYFFNKKCTKEEYKELLQQERLGSFKNLKKIKKKFQSKNLKFPRKSNYLVHSENVIGDYITDSKDIYDCFDVEKTDTAAYSWGVEYSKDIYDSDFIYYGENTYENISNAKSTNIAFSLCMINGTYDMMYCMMCFNNTHNCFGSISLKQNKYCILNKQYESEEYKEMCRHVIEHMKKSGEYGEFFPVQLSHFGYNESISQDYFPLTKEEASRKGFLWKEQDAKEYRPQTYEIPDDIKNVRDTIINEMLICTQCQKNYRIIPQELAFYRRAQMALPRKCHICRHRDRMKQRNPRKLWVRKCQKCGTKLQSSYAEARLEIVYCEECYLKIVY